MNNLPIAIGAIALTVLALDMPHDGRPGFELKEEQMTIEFTSGKDEAVVVFQAESEVRLRQLAVRNPDGDSALSLDGGGGQGVSISGFVVESNELPLRELREIYPEGRYDMRARAKTGQKGRGSALLAHDLLPAPAMIYPREGDLLVPTNLIVGWIPAPQAISYTIVLEQRENDGLTVKLPPDQASFEVPLGVLSRGMRTHVEVGAVHANGNTTFIETSFTTR